MDVVAHIFRVVEFAQHDEDAVALVGLQHLVESVVDRKHERESNDKHRHHLGDAFLFINQVISQGEDEQAAQDDVHRRLAPNQGEDEQQDGHSASHHHPTCARETLAVKHEDERDENDGGSGVVLQQHQSHWDENQCHRDDLVFALLQVDIQTVQVTRYRQSRGHFGKFRRLELDSPELNP